MKNFKERLGVMAGIFVILGMAIYLLFSTVVEKSIQERVDAEVHQRIEVSSRTVSMAPVDQSVYIGRLKPNGLEVDINLEKSKRKLENVSAKDALAIAQESLSEGDKLLIESPLKNYTVRKMNFGGYYVYMVALPLRNEEAPIVLYVSESHQELMGFMMEFVQFKEEKLELNDNTLKDIAMEGLSDAEKNLLPHPHIRDIEVKEVFYGTETLLKVTFLGTETNRHGNLYAWVSPSERKVIRTDFDFLKGSQSQF